LAAGFFGALAFGGACFFAGAVVVCRPCCTLDERLRTRAAGTGEWCEVRARRTAWEWDGPDATVVVVVEVAAAVAGWLRNAGEGCRVEEPHAASARTQIGTSGVWVTFIG
jgi:hypothetical protein